MLGHDCEPDRLGNHGGLHPVSSANWPKLHNSGRPIFLLVVKSVGLDCQQALKVSIKLFQDIQWLIRRAVSISKLKRVAAHCPLTLDLPCAPL